ncbi:hypothetical protein J4Q44_G00350730, partial [Coregonus suidteri]
HTHTHNTHTHINTERSLHTVFLWRFLLLVLGKTKRGTLVFMAPRGTHTSLTGPSTLAPGCWRSQHPARTPKGPNRPQRSSSTREEKRRSTAGHVTVSVGTRAVRVRS